MENWDEIRTAYQVARLGTVSGAADALGVHHATVIRHIDALEARMGVKLFQRHARGYTATEAGRDLFQVAQATEDQFNQLSNRIKGQGEGVTGDLVVTSLAGMAHVLTPVLVAFRAENPGLKVRYLTGPRLFRLEYGEAHVAIRAGSAPEQPDNVVQPFYNHPFDLVASDAYIAARGMPTKDTLKDHDWVGFDDPESRAPVARWMRANVSDDRILFKTEESNPMLEVIRAGAGIGFVARWDRQAHSDLHEVMPSDPDWAAPLWLVTHVDLHRTPKVQACLKFLKAAAREWSC